MARIFMDGFESGDLGFHSQPYSTVPLSSSQTGRTGTYCAGNTAGAYLNTPISPSKSSLYIAGKFYFSSVTAASRIFFQFLNGATVLGSLVCSQSGNILIYNGTAAGTLLDTSDLSMSIGSSVWHLIEIYYLPHLSSGTFTVKVNGIEFCSVTGVQTAPSTSDITSINHGSVSPTSITVFWDDIIVDDASWVGSSSIQGLAVTGAGATTQFDPSSGSNYQCVDEIPSSDADYISTNVADEVDTYACGNLTGTINSIKAVQVQARCMQEGTPAVPKVQLITRPASTDRASSSKSVQTFAPSTVANIWELNPEDSAAWESADVNGMEIGVKAVAS